MALVFGLRANSPGSGPGRETLGLQETRSQSPCVGRRVSVAEGLPALVVGKVPFQRRVKMSKPSRPSKELIGVISTI